MAERISVPSGSPRQNFKKRAISTPPAPPQLPVRIGRHENTRCLDDPAHPRLDLLRLFAPVGSFKKIFLP
ncbi:MAG TPA: hypothetical protein PK490_21325 [Prosthecobacter sp.]|nr:hypothetical protein [Prosthecobacter sp.]